MGRKIGKKIKIEKPRIIYRNEVDFFMDRYYDFQTAMK